MLSTFLTLINLLLIFVPVVLLVVLGFLSVVVGLFEDKNFIMMKASIIASLICMLVLLVTPTQGVPFGFKVILQLIPIIISVGTILQIWVEVKLSN